MDPKIIELLLSGRAWWEVLLLCIAIAVLFVAVGPFRRRAEARLEQGVESRRIAKTRKRPPNCDHADFQTKQTRRTKATKRVVVQGIIASRRTFAIRVRDLKIAVYNQRFSDADPENWRRECVSVKNETTLDFGVEIPFRMEFACPQTWNSDDPLYVKVVSLEAMPFYASEPATVRWPHTEGILQQ